MQMWDQQPWESSESHSNFKNFFLMLPTSERTLTRAYRNYIRYTKPHIPLEDVERKEPGGNWKDWSLGLDSSGSKIPGSTSWKERAEAYDRYIREIGLADAKLKVELIRKKEAQDYNSLLSAWEKTLLAYQKQIDIGTKELDLNKMSKSMLDLINAREKISNFGKKAQGIDDLPDENDKSFNIKWKEHDENASQQEEEE